MAELVPTAPSTSGGGKLVLIVTAVLALGLGGFFAGRLGLGGGRGRDVETRVSRELHEIQMSRLGKDGAFGYMVTLPSDCWSTGEAMAGLGAFGAPEDRALMGRLAEYILTRGVTRVNADGTPAFDGYPVGTGDTVGGGEPTGYAIAGIAIARARYALPIDSDLTRLGRFLVAQQNPDGSFSSVFGMGEVAARASATQDCVLGLLAIDSYAPEPTPEFARALSKAAAYIGDSFDQRAKGWYARKRRAWGGGQLVGGCSEAYAWGLLELGDYLRAAGSGLPPSADAALLAYAGAYEPATYALDALPVSDVEDYQFDAPPGLKTSWGQAGHRWCWIVWRLLAAERLGRFPGNPRKDDWRQEARRLRARLPELPPLLEKAFTFQSSEGLLLTSLLGDAPEDDPLRASLYARIRHWRQNPVK